MKNIFNLGDRKEKTPPYTHLSRTMQLTGSLMLAGTLTVFAENAATEVGNTDMNNAVELSVQQNTKTVTGLKFRKYLKPL